MKGAIQSGQFRNTSNTGRRQKKIKKSGGGIVAREEYHSYANTWTLVTVPIFQHIPLRSI
jgi:hypothetical protein